MQLANRVKQKRVAAGDRTLATRGGAGVKVEGDEALVRRVLDDLHGFRQLTTCV